VGSSEGCQPPRMMGKSGFRSLVARAIWTVARTIGAGTREILSCDQRIVCAVPTPRLFNQSSATDAFNSAV
jgi:hypothetical protein